MPVITIPIYQWKSLRVGRYGGVDVVGFRTAESGVLKGQTLTCFIDNYPTEEEARKAHPEVNGFVNKWTAPQVNLNHLPDEGEE